MHLSQTSRADAGRRVSGSALEDLGHLRVRGRGKAGELRVETGTGPRELGENLGELVLQIPPDVSILDGPLQVDLVPLHLEAVPELLDPVGVRATM